MDIQLPQMDGYEATRRIKSNPEMKEVPVIAVTSYALAGDDAKAMAAGCTAYISKPFSPRASLAKAREFLGKLQQGPNCVRSRLDGTWFVRKLTPEGLSRLWGVIDLGRAGCTSRRDCAAPLIKPNDAATVFRNQRRTWRETEHWVPRLAGGLVLSPTLIVLLVRERTPTFKSDGGEHFQNRDSQSVR
jgi:DNA-binding response OmpR family regulator